MEQQTYPSLFDSTYISLLSDNNLPIAYMFFSIYYHNIPFLKILLPKNKKIHEKVS